ncbi:MAG: hypothetical protein QXP71_00425 [Desulfurococcaceae archaeon]|uniref:Uncharacterized protein n=1 Tax=Staphylothermus marinus TaxID=2280 RepID=A0A7C4HD48_STAMA
MNIELIIWLMIVLITVFYVTTGSNIVLLIVFISIIVFLKIIIWLIKNDFFKENSRENRK